MIGEAHCTNKRRSIADLRRLRHVRELLGTRAEGARLVLFSRTGLADDLLEAGARDDVDLVGLSDMYRQ